jgi:outer membrane lipase/esterase
MSLAKKTVLSLAVCAAVSTTAAAGVPFDQMITFGASSEDIGQFPDIDFLSLAAPTLIPPPGAGLDGSTGFRFTNLDPNSGERGRAWVERLSSNLGIGGLVPSTPLLFPGERTDIPDTQNIDFAFGGGRSTDVLEAVVGESQVTHPIDDQVEADLSATSPGFVQRLQSGALTTSKRTLYVVNPAGNDVRDTSVADPAQDGVTAARNSLAVIDALVAAGARNIITPTFPPLGQLSESSNVAPDGSRTPKAQARTIAAEAYNKAMAEGLPKTGANIIAVDFQTLFFEMLEDPAAFGFNGQIDNSRYCYSASDFSITGVNCTEAPGLGKSSGGNPGDFIVNDGLHPTQATAQILSDYTASILRAPGMIALLPETALADARAFGNTITDYQTGRRWTEQPSGFDVFASVQGQKNDHDDGFATPGANSDVVDLTLGATYEINQNWFVGGAVGSQDGDTNIDNAGSEYDNSTLMGSLFVGYRSQYLFSDLTLSAGSTDLDDIKRVIPLGSTLVRTEKGDTDADLFGVTALVGIDMTSGENAPRFGPFLSLDYMDVEVDGYAEQGSSSTAMAFGDQDRDSLIGGMGLFGSYPFQVSSTNLEAYGDIAYRKEFEDDSDDVKAVVKNLSSGAHFRMPGYNIDDESVVVRAGISAHLGALRCSLSGSYEDNDRETTYLGFNIAYDL